MVGASFLPLDRHRRRGKCQDLPGVRRIRGHLHVVAVPDLLPDRSLLPPFARLILVFSLLPMAFQYDHTSFS
jgi:hypothetical protein